CRFRVPLNFRQTFISYALPKNFAAVLIQRVNLPGVLGIVLHWFHITVQAVARFVFGAGRDCGADEYFVTPNDGTGMRESRYRCFPAGVERLLSVEFHGCSLSFDNSSRAWPAK